MTEYIAIDGSYSDFKLIKSRSVCQVVVEIPVEKAETFLSLFGVPQPGAEKPVALALLNADKPKPEKPKQSWAGMSYAQRSGILRNDVRFQQWLGVADEEGAAFYIRKQCGVESCSKIDGIPLARQKFDAMESLFRQATGQMAESR